MTERDEVTVELAAGELRDPHVYEPSQGLTDRSYYTAIVRRWELSDLGDLLPTIRQPDRDGVYWVALRSRTRPEVAVGDGNFLEDLVTELARLDARNLPRDCVFDGRRVALTLAPYVYDAHGIPRRGLALRRVTVHLS